MCRAWTVPVVLFVAACACSQKSAPVTAPPVSESSRATQAGSTTAGSTVSRDGGRANASTPASVQAWTGVLRTGVMAIGAETTGVTLTTDTDVLELRATGAVLESLAKLDGQRITVRGTLTEREGVEVRRRRIIDVTAIVPR